MSWSRSLLRPGLQRALPLVALPLVALPLLSLTGCPSSPEPPTLSLEGAVAPCQELRVVAAGEGEALQWSSDDPLLALEVAEDGRSVALRPLPSNVDRSLTIRASGAGGEAEQTLSWDASTPGAGMAPGTVWGCAPFVLGVASGGPTSDAVLLWTQAETDEPLRWELRAAEDGSLVAEGSATPDPAADHTVRVEVGGLPADTRFTYRFFTAEGVGSPLGRTRTLPAAGMTPLRLAAASCTSLFSGWFNAYRHLAHDGVDLVVHTGDYVYDFVDAEEEIRLTDPYPIRPSNPAEWEERFRLYLADPDFRAARAAHPWVAMWDNHDSDTGNEAGQGTRAAFRQYVPMRLDPAHPDRVWRSLRWGDLVDLYMMDVYTEPDESSLLGVTQAAWLAEELDGSDAAWRVLATQKLVNTLGDPTGGVIGQATPWDRVPDERAAFYERLAQHGDNLILSGDLHFTIAGDLVADPWAETPAPSAGVELLAAGVTRGNFDETLCGGLCDDELVEAIGNIRGLLLDENPHYADLELIEHGYGHITIDEERITAEMRYFPIREASDELRPGPVLVAERGADRWTR